jgi:hypothetical protein
MEEKRAERERRRRELAADASASYTASATTTTTRDRESNDSLARAPSFSRLSRQSSLLSPRLSLLSPRGERPSSAHHHSTVSSVDDSSSYSSSLTRVSSTRGYSTLSSNPLSPRVRERPSILNRDDDSYGFLFIYFISVAV